MLHDVVGGAPDLRSSQPTGAPTRRFCAQPQEVNTDRHSEGVEIETIELIGLSAFVREALRQSPQPTVAKRARLIGRDQLLTYGFGYPPQVEIEFDACGPYRSLRVPPDRRTSWRKAD